jgi:flagellar basal body rod protein FlgG
MGIINGMTRAAHALAYWERRQEVVSNNLANADTNGFRAQRTFAQAIGDALPFAGTALDTRAGALKQTGNPLDVALGGDGYFVVDSAAGERFTRGGSLRLDANSRLVDQDGNAILGEGGPIVLPPGTVSIDARGGVSVDGKQIDRLRIETVPAGTEMAHESGTLLVPDPSRTPVANDARSVEQGYLEDSNVNTVGSMVDMISIQRSYAAVQRTMTTLDGIRQTISNELGKPV